MGFLGFFKKLSEATKDKPSLSLAAKVARGGVGERRTAQLAQAAARAMQAREATAAAKAPTLPVGTILPLARMVKAKRMGFDVLEGHRAGSARELTAMLKKGIRQPPTGKPVIPLSAAPAQMVQAGDTKGLPRAQRIPDPPPVRPRPVQNRPGSIADTAERFRRWREQRAVSSQEERNLRIPIRDRTKGMSWGERQARLSSGGKLLSAEAVAAKTLIPQPNLRQIVSSSEEAEESARQAALRNRGGKRRGGIMGLAGRAGARMGIGGAGGAAGAAGLLGGVAVGAVALGAAFVNLGFIVERFSAGVLESSRGLAKFSPAIANTFAMLEWQNVQLQAQLARNTSGTATELGEKVGQLRESIQPLKETFATFKNLAAEGAAILVKDLVENVVNPLMTPLIELARWAEIIAGRDDKATGWPFTNMMDDIGAGDWNKAVNKPPGVEDAGEDNAAVKAGVGFVKGTLGPLGFFL